MDKGYKITIGILVLIIIALIYIHFRDRSVKKEEVKGWETLSFKVPTTVDPTVFGKYYWNAFHTLADKIPCGGCRGFAEKFMIYFHDLVNVKVGHPIFDRPNYDYFNDSICKLNMGQDFNTAFNIPQPQKV